MSKKTSNVMYFGLDGEMSGNDIELGCKLIQIGLATFNGTDRPVSFGSGIQPIGEMTWQEQAAAVHQLTKEQIAEFPDPYTVDQQCYDWLVAHGADEKRRNKTIVVGFNVGAFDMPFIRATLPKTASLISRQTVDLNAVCFSLSIATPLNNNMVTTSTWKTAAKKYATSKIMQDKNSDWRAHNAEYDAVHALYCLYFLALKGVPLNDW
jgi:DNA polymerase III epsilon subunit-like protein